ncbi:cell wall surface anchor family protein [Staphylococcus warneri]|uniref:SasC/FmtB family protein n=6 Tax=Staphylococcus warneri TaxID=1292 RepID=UPI000F6F9943|nr:SasC/FmtB family protein [Staphylococcus warneri]VED31408.1 cell wall surface anchor family protein [Staphylococcus warneri]
MKHPRKDNQENKKINYFSIRKLKGYGVTSITIASLYLLFGHSNIANAAEINQPNEIEFNYTNSKVVKDKQDEKQLNQNSEIINEIPNNTNNEATPIMDDKQVTSEQSISGNNEQLKQLIQQYKKINLDDKTDESIKEFNHDISNAEQFLQKQSTQAEIDGYYRNFINSASKLKRKKNNDQVLTIKKQNANKGVPATNSEPSSNNQHSQVVRQPRGTSFRAVPNQNSNDPLKYNETNTGVINGHFDQVSGGNLPNQNTSLTVVKDVIGWTSLSTDPDKEFPIVMTTRVRNYPTFMSDSSAPYGVVLARTTDGFERRVPDPRVAGIYQDIDVAPNSELVVDFISSALATINAWPGVKAKITTPDGNRVLFDKQINGMGKYPTGKLNLMINIPSDVDRVRLSFIPISNSYTLTSNQTSSAYGFGDNPNYMYGGAVSRVNVNSGAYVVSRVTEVKYDFTSDSSTSNYARGTITVILENKGHTSSNETIYRVTLPQGTKFVSATNASTNYNEATSILTLNAGKVSAGTTKTISYTVDFPAVKPSIVDLDGNVTYRTDASFRGDDRQKSGIDEVEQQQVAILMYKEDLRNKYNDTKQYLDTINEADYTTVSVNNLKLKLDEAKAILDEANNNVPMADRKNQDFINQITTEIEHEKIKLKRLTPSIPVMTTNEENASLTVTPQGDTDKMTVQYIGPNGDAKEVIATKAGNQWRLNDTPTGFSIDNRNGSVTVNYQGVQNGSEVSAYDTSGNSDPSDEVRKNVPLKQDTPLAPVITPDEANASVTVTPQGDSDKMTVHYIAPNGDPKEVIATKTGDQWTLNETPTGISIDNTSGAVTVSYQGIQNGSEVISTEKYGNSDTSPESRANVPVKEATPAAPTITPDEANASVTVIPQGDSDKMTVHYVAPNGDPKEILASKVGNQWTLNETPIGISIDNTSGAVTVSYQGVQNGSEVTANESHGNSDSSTEARANVPLKEATPMAPVITPDEANASVTVTPQGDSDKMTVHYVAPNGDPKEVIATKTGNQWLLNETPTGISIDNASGAVTVSYQGIQNGSEVSASETHGNSDISTKARANVPVKETTPMVPVITSDEASASVTVTPQGESDKMTVHYIAPNGDPKEVIATKVGNQWALKETPTGISIDNTSGAVTVNYQGVQNGSEVSVSETHGNSDASPEARANVPVKEATPAAPTITPDEASASVTVIPQGDSDKMTVHYVAPNGDPKEVIATKVGNQWTLNETPTGISIDNTSGAVTVNYQGVQNGSEISASETHGNSDVSPEVQTNVPVKETTPVAPVITPDEASASVTVTPQGESDKMTVHYVAPNGDAKEVIVTKVGNQWTLNETPTGISIDNANGAVTISYQGVQNGSEVTANESHGNSDTSTEARANVPVKEATPMAPVITPDEASASVTVTPQSDADKMTIHYVAPNGDAKEVIATKVGNQWTLKETPTGISIDNASGAVTISYQGVQNGSEVTANESHGNSDTSTEARANVPVKEATPAAPTITPDEANASVTVTPQGESDKMTIHYVAPNGEAKEVVATKVGNQWTLNDTPTGISIDNTSGAVTVNYQGVQNGSEVTANESHGNSDASPEARANVPMKEATPTAPVIIPDEAKASVTVIPQGDADKMTVHYVAPNGDPKEVIATKVGNQWTLNDTPIGISIDNTSGAITVGYNGVQNGSEVTANESHGNSDASPEARANVPMKEATPTAPVVTQDETNASVTVTPQGDADKMTVHYVAPNGDPKEVVATKVGNQWTLNEVPTGISIDNTSGAVTVNYQGVQNGSEISASETHGNSDASPEARANVPMKEATPTAPVVTQDETNASVTVTPQGDADKMTVHYVAPNGDAKEVIATKVGNQWTLNETPTGISIDSASGAVTISYQGVQNGSEVTANESHGNSDTSPEARANVPVKEATPMAPVITPDEASASVTVTPQSDADKMTIHYVAPNGEAKEVVATKVGNQWTLNDTPTGISIDNTSGAVTISYQGVQNGSEVTANESQGNSNASTEARSNVPVKEATPTAPVITPDEANASVTVTPQGESDKMTVHYIASNGDSKEVIATKKDNQWTLNETTTGISIDNTSGAVTVSYQGVQNGSEVTANESHGNSDTSPDARANVPMKEATPMAPVITSDEASASVTVTPQSDADKMTIHYVAPNGEAKEVVATKVGNQWTLNDTPTGISIDNTSGAVTVNYQGVQNGSEVTANESHGNSDASTEEKANVPVKEATPKAPIIITDEASASVTITPESNADKMTVHYIAPNGDPKEVIATKTGDQWTLSETPVGISIDNTSGTVTVNYQGVKNGSEVSASETHGNSNPSEKIVTNVPVKQSKPMSPIITWDREKKSVSIKPNGKIDKMKIQIISSANNTDKELIATKVVNQWKLNKKMNGIQIDRKTGIVTIDYRMSQNFKELLVSSKFGNSDESEIIHFIIPKFKGLVYDLDNYNKQENTVYEFENENIKKQSVIKKQVKASKIELPNTGKKQTDEKGNASIVLLLLGLILCKLNLKRKDL